MKEYARRICGGIAVCSLLCTPRMWAGDNWRVYTNCRLLPDAYLDGDSFHVQHGRTHYIFRLYFVDAPETSDAYADRIAEQAAYFGKKSSDIPRLGAQAARYTRRFLAAPFTVYTKKEDARGQSDRKRYFALIRAGDKWLGEELVAQGLARIYGWRTDLPDGLPARKHVANLHVDERSAKRKRKGGWKR